MQHRLAIGFQVNVSSMPFFVVQNHLRWRPCWDRGRVHVITHRWRTVCKCKSNEQPQYSRAHCLPAKAVRYAALAGGLAACLGFLAIVCIPATARVSTESLESKLLLLDPSGTLIHTYWGHLKLRHDWSSTLNVKIARHDCVFCFLLAWPAYTQDCLMEMISSAYSYACSKKTLSTKTGGFIACQATARTWRRA